MRNLISLLVLFVILKNNLVEQFFNRTGRVILSNIHNRHFYELPLLHRHCVSGLVRKYVLICSYVRGYTPTFAKVTEIKTTNWGKWQTQQTK